MNNQIKKCLQKDHMKKLILILLFIPVCLFAQDNYFVNDGKSVVKLNHDFELEWAVGEFKGATQDVVVNQVTGVITVLHKHYELCGVST